MKEIAIAYECLNAIGNSLVLNEMLTDVIKTFVSKSGAIGGKFLKSDSQNEAVVTVGKNFYHPERLSNNIDSFEILAAQNGGYILDIPIQNEHFLFLYRSKKNLELLGNMFSNFRTKLANSIEACRNIEKLHNQVVEEKNKNEINEKMMISKSRMAIMGEMIGMIAHQWRQPITIIGMITNNTILDIQLGKVETNRVLEDLGSIDKQVHYLSRTIDDFRNFFRPNKLPQKISSDEISKELLSIIGKNFENYRIEIDFTGDLQTKFTSYKNELLQVFLNILSNAKDAFVQNNTNAPKLTFNTKSEPEAIEFSIRDNAGGIPPDIVERIFEPYFTTKPYEHGTGLGLYMSSIIIEKHLNGSIQVKTDSNGTVFHIKIPSLKEGTESYVF